MCKWCELVIAIVILVFALWETTYSKWIIVVAAIALLIHSFIKCKYCYCTCEEEAKPTKKKRR